MNRTSFLLSAALGAVNGTHKVVLRTHKVLPVENSEAKENETQKEIQELPGMVREVWGHYMGVIKRNPRLYTLTQKRLGMGVRRLRDLEQRKVPRENWVTIMKLCVDRLHGSAFHNGENEYRKKYVDWEILFRSTEQFEKWLDDERWRK